MERAGTIRYAARRPPRWRWPLRLAVDAAWVAVGVTGGLDLIAWAGWMGPPPPRWCATTELNVAALLGFWFLVARWSVPPLVRLSARVERRLERWEDARAGRKPKSPFPDEL